MAIVYPNPVKIARMNAVTAQAGATAVLEIGTAGMAAVLATIPLSNPIAPAATGVGLLTLSGFPRTVAATAGGVAAAARIRTATGGTDIITGWVVGLPGSGAEVIVDNTNIAINQNVQVQSVTVTHAA